MEIDITEIPESELENVSFRSSHKWNTEALETFAKELRDQYSGKIVRMPIDAFYSKFYTGDNTIKHQAFYCAKKLKTAFKSIGIEDCRVSTTKKWNGVIVVQL